MDLWTFAFQLLPQLDNKLLVAERRVTDFVSEIHMYDNWKEHPNFE